MTHRPRTALWTLLAALLLMCLVAPVSAAQTEQPPTNNTSSATPTSTPTTTPNSSDDDVVHVTAGNGDDDEGTTLPSGITINLLNGNEKNKIDTQSVAGSVGPSVVIHDSRYHKETGEMWIDLTVKSPTGVEMGVTDAFAGLGGQQGNVQAGVASSPNNYIQLEKGTHRLKVPAEIYEGNARVLLSTRPATARITLKPGGGGALDRLLRLDIALAGIAAFLIGIVARVGYKFYRQQETGAPEALDGTTITHGTVGMESEVSDDE